MNLEATLTKRETEIVEPLAWGATKKEVAGMLDVATKTIDNHAQNIYRKTEVRSVGQLAAWFFCKYHGVNPMVNPLKALLFFLMLSVNEINADKDMFRVRVTKTVRCKSKRKD